MSRCNICGKTNCGGPLVHLQDGHTYPINILGNAATASDANPRVYKKEADENVVSFQVGSEEREDKANVYTKEIDFVEHAYKDAEGNVITETYLKKGEQVDEFNPFVYDGDATGSYEITYSKDSIYTEMWLKSVDPQLWVVHVDDEVFACVDGVPYIHTVDTLVLQGKVVKLIYKKRR